MALIQLAYQTRYWIDDPWEEIVGEIAGLRFQGIEGVDAFYKAYESRIEPALMFLKEHGITLSGLVGGGDFVLKDEWETIFDRNLKIAEFLQKVGAHHLILETGRKEIAESIQQDFITAAHTLSELGKRCLDFEVNACILPQTGQRVETNDEIDRMMNLVDTRAVFLCPDTGQLRIAGDDPTSTFDIYGECIRHVYFSDVEYDEEKPESSLFCDLGQGAVDFQRIKDALDRLNYDGWIVINTGEDCKTPIDSACVSKDYVENLFGYGRLS